MITWSLTCEKQFDSFRCFKSSHILKHGKHFSEFLEVLDVPCASLNQFVPLFFRHKSYITQRQQNLAGSGPPGEWRSSSMQWSLGVLSLLCSTCRSTKLAQLRKLDLGRIKLYIGADKVDIFRDTSSTSMFRKVGGVITYLLNNCLWLCTWSDVAGSIPTASWQQMWTKTFERVFVQRLQGLWVAFCQASFSNHGNWCWGTLGIFERLEMIIKRDASSNIWGCFAERRSDQAIARLEPNIEGTDGSQSSTAASSAQIWFITTWLIKARLQRRK